MADTNNPHDAAAANLQAIIAEERRKRIEAENANRALIEEFTSCNDFEDVRQKFRDKVREMAPQALINIADLANFSESDSVRASLNKWIIDWAMSDKIEGRDGELRELLSSLKKNDGKEEVGVKVVKDEQED